MKNTITTIISICFLFLISQNISAQRNRWKEHNFKDSTSLSPIDEKYLNEDAVIVKNVKLFEFKGGFLEYTIQKTSYNLIRVNNDIGLEAYNKIYIPMYGVNEIIDIQVRFISPNGVVTNLKRSDIRKVENLEGYGDFTVFAIKGAEIGGEIEYKYTLKMKASFSHLEIYYNRYPIQEARFELVAPSGLFIHIQGFNGFPEFEIDAKGRKAWYASLKDVEPYETEDYALNTSNRLKVAYAANTGIQYLYQSWPKMIEEKHAFFEGFTKANEKRAKKISTQLKLDSLSTPQKIQMIQSFGMDSISLTNSYYFPDLNAILDQRIAFSAYSKLKVMAVLFKANGINYKTLWATDKYFAEYIDDYPYSFNQDRLLFYFPEIDQYLDPFSRFYPLGIIHKDYLDTKSYFVSERSKSLKRIEPVDTSRSKQVINIHIELDSNWVTHIKSKYELYGYAAASMRSFLAYIKEDEMDELFEEFHSYHMMDLKMEDVVITNDSLDPLRYPQLPLILEFEMSSSMITEKAGTDYLLKLGSLLRPASDFYHIEERRQDIIMDYPICSYTTLELAIPEGYELTNPQILKQDASHTDTNGIATYFYNTEYKLENNQLKYKITNGNTQCRYAVDEFKSLQKVINAISDLSMTSLVFKKNESTILNK